MHMSEMNFFNCYMLFGEDIYYTLRRIKTFMNYYLELDRVKSLVSVTKSC